MDKKFKILAASDIHGEEKKSKRLAELAAKEKVDLVILCGDITGFRETKNIIKPFIDRNQKVLIIPGNHDSFATADFLAEFYGIKNIHGYAIQYENIGFFGAGGAIDLPLFPGSISERELFETLKKAHEKIKGIEKKVMITHMHPKDSISEFSGIRGSEAIKKAIKEFKPDILIHGHIHEAAGTETKMGKTRIFNVDDKGKIIEL